MVSLGLNFFKYYDLLRQELVSLKNKVEMDWDPFVAAWLILGFLDDDYGDNVYLRELVLGLLNWSRDDDAWNVQRNIGALSLLASPNLLDYIPANERLLILSRLQTQLTAIDHTNKFSHLRDPEQFYLIAAGIGNDRSAETLEIRNRLIQIARDQLQGIPKRKILFTAALRELGESDDLAIPANGLDVGDLIVAVWWKEKYLPTANSGHFWKSLGNLKEVVGYTDADSDQYHRMLSVPEKVMLYIAIRFEIEDPDPVFLFDWYPLHPRIKEISGSLFMKEEYVPAVFEALKALNETIKAKSGLSKSETELIVTAFGDPQAKEIKNAVIKFNDLDPASMSYKSQQNEQRGLSHLALGVFYAFRHPKGHEPKDSKLLEMDAFEALDQLVCISYLMKRVESAK